MDAVDELGMKAQSPERTMSSVSSKRRLKKYMYKRQPLLRCDKDDARRAEAKSFLASITLDKFRSRSPNVVGSSEQEGIEESTSPILLRRLQNVSMHAVVEEGLAASRGGSQKEQRLHEMAVEMFDYHTPNKSSFPRSHEHDSDHMTTPTALHFIPPMMVRTRSLVDSSSASVVGHLAGSDLQRRAAPLVHSHSLGGSGGGGVAHAAGEVQGMVHYCGTNLRHLQTDSRIVLMASSSMFVLYSVLGYKRGLENSNTERPKGQRTRLNSTSLHLELDCELGTIQEVSLSHLFLPLHVSLDTETNTLGLPVGVTKKLSGLYGLTDCLDPDVPGSGVSSAAKSFPWSFFSEHHGALEVLLLYHPLCMDNMEHFVGTHISVFPLEGYTVSVIQYGKASGIKRGINRQFADTFPHVKITLSNLRSIKKDVCAIAKEVSMDMSVVAYCYVYFEKLVMMGKVNKLNRKLVAGVCLLLAAKFFSDMKKPELKELLEEVADTWKVGSEDIVNHELPVLVSLNFSLFTPTHQAKYHYDRLKDY